MNEFDAICQEQGWDPYSIISILLEYIENQQDDDTFIDFLRVKQDEENELSRKVGDLFS